MRIVFCDDNEEVLFLLQKYVKEFFKELGSFQPDLVLYRNGDDLLSSEANVDIAFLDVEMPGQSGIHVGAKLQEVNPQIIIFIVTSYPDYLDEAMRFHVFRYLSKPIDKNRLFRNLKDAVRQYNQETRLIPINTSDGLISILAQKIICVESVQRKCIIRTIDGDIWTADGIEHWRSVLALPSFYSTYRSFIINMRYVSQIKKDTVILRYRDMSMEAYLARRRYSDFKDHYLLYMESIK